MFKDVVGFEEYFSISDDGKIFSKRTNKELKQTISKTGYLTVATKIGGRNGLNKCFKIHILVAKAFIPNIYNLPFVNHIDSEFGARALSRRFGISHVSISEVANYLTYKEI